MLPGEAINQDVIYSIINRYFEENNPLFYDLLDICKKPFIATHSNARAITGHTRNLTDDMIKSSGYRISPFEVESVLLTHPAVFECAVTGIADDRRGQIVKATIVVKEGFKPCRDLAREIKLFAKQNTANYKTPRLIEFVDELPKTHSGKIRRVEIRNKK